MFEPKISFLVIDDEEIILQLTEDIITFLGYRCFTCPDGFQAVESVRKHDPQAVFLDFHLPGISGERVLEELKANFPGLQVLITSGRVLDDDERERIKAKGATGFITKPFTVDTLKEEIKKLLIE